MGTEFSNDCLNEYLNNCLLVKLNNPLMGTETEWISPYQLAPYGTLR